MKKRNVAISVGAFVIALAVIYTGASWYVGQRAEHVIRHAVQAYNQALQNHLSAEDVHVTLTIEDYQRGVFASDTRYALTIRDDGTTTTYALVGHLVHGPFPYTRLKQGRLWPLLAVSDLHLQLPEAKLATLSSWTDGDAPLLSAHTTLTFTGAGRSVWHIQPLQAPNGAVSFSGGVVTLALANGLRTVDANAAFDYVRIKLPRFDMSVRDAAMHMHVRRTAAQAITFEIGVTLGRFASNAGSMPPRQIRNWHLAARGTFTAGLLDGAVTYRMGHVQVGTLDLGSLVLKGHVADFDVAAWRALRAAMRQPVPTQSFMAAIQACGERIAAFLASEPVVVIDRFEWQTPAGQSSVRAALHLAGTDMAVAEEGYRALLQPVEQAGLSVSVELPMVIALLAQPGMPTQVLNEQTLQTLVDNVAARLTAQGLVRRDGDTLKTSIQYRDGTITLNGEQMPFALFLVRLFATIAAVRY